MTIWIVIFFNEIFMKTIPAKIRNKENSKQQFLDAVGKILRTEGYSALKINNIASITGLDKKTDLQLLWWVRRTFG